MLPSISRPAPSWTQKNAMSPTSDDDRQGKRSRCSGAQCGVQLRIGDSFVWLAF